MIIVYCTKCPFAVRVMGDPAEVQSLVGNHSEFWPNHYVCPLCAARANGFYEVDIEIADLERLHPRDLTPQEAFAAFNGLGLPTEQQCTKEVVETLLREQPVRRVAATNITGAQRCYLHHLELWDGTKVYFGAGADGAVVYRISPPYSYTERVSHEHPSFG